MDTIRVELRSRNTRDLSMAELEQIAVAMRSVVLSAEGDPQVDVIVQGSDSLGVGNTWNDVLEIIIPNAEFVKDTIWTALSGAAVHEFAKRFKNARAKRRPRGIEARTPDNKLIDTIQIADPAADVNAEDENRRDNT